ncbi:MAG TPA: M13 family metallopeptidase [Burkholderiaceae bacterium]|nr:M13 family metallopeptidase [Burkholderiaceae bacterium]
MSLRFAFVGLVLMPLVVHSAPVLDIAGLSTEVAACADFDRYVNGKWHATVPIPADKGRIGSFDSLRDDSRRIVNDALAEAARQPSLLDSPGKRLAADYYVSGMDLQSIEKRGLTSLAPLLSEIDALKERSQLPIVLAKLASYRIAAPFSVLVRPDEKDKRRSILVLDQSGLGLPDRDDYFRDDARTLSLRKAYEAYRLRLAQLSAGDASPATDAAVLSFETDLARVSRTRVERRDPNVVYNLYSVDSLTKFAPGFDWAAYFSSMGVAATVPVNVTSPQFAQQVAHAATSAPLAAWRAYLRQHVLDAAAQALPAAYVAAHFDYRSRAIRGLEAQPSRAEQVIVRITGNFGSEPLAEGLGQLYVARAFSPHARARAIAMTEDIKAALRARIEKLDWMSAPTKSRAIGKLDAMVLKIGFPDRWKTYDGLTIARDDYVGNWLRANAWEHQQRLADLSRPVDRTRWFTSPHLVNAFAGGLNEIVFPAAILQPPFFNESADDAVNYGGIGAVIGHEITHHFDDRGRQYDEVGNLAQWWSAEDAARYKERAAKVAQQYSGYAPLPEQTINGQQTLGENISDLGGVKLAYDALQRAVARQPPGKIDNFTPEQRFFLSFATIWRTKYRTEALIDNLRTDSHSPARYRVLGPLANVPEFAQAFNCPADAPMMRAPVEQISIW